MADNVVPVTNKKTGKIELFDSNQGKKTPNSTNRVKFNTDEQDENESQINPSLDDSKTLNYIDNKCIASSGNINEKLLSKEKSRVDRCSLFDFISSIYTAEKPLQQNELSRQLVNSVISENLIDDQITELYNLAKGKDPELKKTRVISELIIRNSCFKKDNYDSILNYLEYVFNQHLNFETGESIMLSTLAKENNVEKMLDIIIDKIDKSIKRQQKNYKEINLPSNKNQEKKITYKTLQDNLTLIAFSWLYYFKHVDINILFSYLSKSIFELTKGEIEDLISCHSLGFVSSMSVSTNKKDFSYLLSFFSKYNSRYQIEITDHKKTIAFLENGNKKYCSEVEDQKELINTSKNKISELESEVIRLKKELTHHSEIAKHQEIHLKDISSKNQSIFLRFLEDEIFNMLLDVQKGLQRLPPKIETAESYLEVVVEKIQEKIKCLK